MIVKDIGHGPMTIDEAYEQYHNLLHYCAKQFRKALIDTGLEYDDLVQAASEGFVNAFNRFDSTKDIKFMTYGSLIIKGHIMRLLRDYSSVYFSRPVKDNGRKLLRKGFDANSNVTDVADFLNCSERMAMYALQYVAYRRVKSMDREQERNPGITLHDVVGNGDDNVDYILYDFVTRLPEKEAEIVRMLSEEKSQVEIGGKVGCAQAHVSRLRKQLYVKWQRYSEGEAI
ncbi:sigma-70 family RNA polymerase sigma factor [Geomicrobium sp. JCM 19038]|uniref:sigma-70 family RNA polymerase sigma factor n=1 Tax=Geomicrobium sp. JCM 19038 TaxID=1460635 RepID=UPI00045F2966|nr:sigma-70 family RNA polymerase sigma factor [Geomicrobium sp. JCM 19038]GAK08977.1 RNA polymerase sporulation specific sigma factor SigF [Geomicrobium sp. JCM 19038]